MAKKKKEKEVVEEPQVEPVVVEAPVVEPEPEPITVVEKPKNKGWEFKDRLYYLKSKRKPISYSIRASGIYWFDEELGYERELRYTANQKTPFVDEMKGDQRLEHMVFRNGALFVPRNKQTLQKLLSLYRPHKVIYV